MHQRTGRSPDDQTQIGNALLPAGLPSLVPHPSNLVPEEPLSLGSASAGIAGPNHPAK